MGNTFLRHFLEFRLWIWCVLDPFAFAFSINRSLSDRIRLRKRKRKRTLYRTHGDRRKEKKVNSRLSRLSKTDSKRQRKRKRRPKRVYGDSTWLYYNANFLNRIENMDFAKSPHSLVKIFIYKIVWTTCANYCCNTIAYTI